MNANEIDALDRELAAMLRDDEGPPDPQPHTRRQRTRFYLVAAAVTLAVAGTVAFGLARWTASSSSSPQTRSGGGTSCAALVQFHGLPYVGAKTDGLTLQPGGPVGSVTIPGCDGAGASRANAVELAGVRSDVAVGLSGQPDEIYVLAGRCIGYSGGELVNCLQTPLDIAGRRYYATRPVEEPTRGARDTTGSLGGHDVDVLRLEGIAPTAAVAVSGRADEIFLAPDVCPLPGLPQLVECLRAKR
jgi:hypothetical protein